MIKKIIQILVNNFSRLIPMKERIVFESNPDFSDNTIILFDNILNDSKYNNYDFYWILKSNNIPDKYRNNSRIKFHVVSNGNILEKIFNFSELLYIFSSSSFVFFSHVLNSPIEPKPGQKVVFLTHGFHFKKGQGRHFNPKKVTDVITLSDLDDTVAQMTYEVEPQKLVQLGYSRNDLLFQKNKGNLESLLGEEVIDKEIIVWLPTFRRHENGLTNDSKKKDNESDIPVIQSIEDLKNLNSILDENNMLLVLKPHPAQNMRFFKVESFSNIVVISNQDLSSNEMHLYDLLSISSCLITDYSSVFIDYLLTDKPIIFTFDDLDMYENNLGFSLPDFSSYMPGIKIKTMYDLFDTIKSKSFNNEYYKCERIRVKKLMHKEIGGKYSNSIIDYYLKD